MLVSRIPVSFTPPLGLDVQVNGSSYWWLDNSETGLSQVEGFNAVLWDRWQFFLDSKSRGLRPTVRELPLVAPVHTRAHTHTHTHTYTHTRNHQCNTS